MALNIVHLVGRVGREPEIKYFDSGKMLCEFTLAVDRRSKKDDGPDWFGIKIWGRSAEVAKDYAKKGTLIGIQGSLSIETWTDRNTGEQRSKPVIQATRLELLGSKRDNEGGGGYNNYPETEVDGVGF